ncbi:MAG: 1-acyl-sn-glycerol-3-phosphate acyltransferase, partial [Spirochaetales bacterium]|nr:1-acyl-sn-glycerol-3-phosphate acyltransferase [Spirochaetales bacterium]
MLKTVAVLGFIWISAALGTPLALVFIVAEAVGLGRLSRPALGCLMRAWTRFILWIMGVRTIVEGLENVPADRKLCFVGNHQGDLDIVMMLAYMPRPVGFIAKSEAAWFPFLNLWIV